jgi:hypothetical protein
VRDQLALEDSNIDVAIRILRNDDDVGDGLSPGQLVRVMLERSGEDDRAGFRRYRGAQPMAVLQRRGDA